MAKTAKKHTASYQKYFDGYVTAKVEKKSGKGYKVKRFYVDNYHVHLLDDKQWKMRKIIYSLLTAGSLCLFLIFSLMPGQRNISTYISVPGCITFLCLIFLVTADIFYISCPRKMTKYEQHKSTSYIKIWSFLTFVFFAITALGNIYFVISHRGSVVLNDYFACCAYLAGGGFSLVINILEKNTEYYEEENDTQLPFYRS